jgi:hypothetical protein
LAGQSSINTPCHCGLRAELHPFARLQGEDLLSSAAFSQSQFEHFQAPQASGLLTGKLLHYELIFFATKIQVFATVDLP